MLMVGLKEYVERFVSANWNVAAEASTHADGKN